MKSSRVLVADDHAVVRQGIRQILAESPEFSIVREASTGAEVLEHLRDPQRTRIVSLAPNLYDRLPENVTRPRVVTAVEKITSSGETEGAWLFDSVTGSIVYLDGLNEPGRMQLSAVEERTR